jgi:hypothetical protein
MENFTPKQKKGLTKTIQALWLEPYNDLTAQELLMLKTLVQKNRDIDEWRKATGFSYKESNDLIDKLQDIIQLKYKNL